MGGSDTRAHVYSNSLDNSQPLARELSDEAKPIALRVPSLSPTPECPFLGPAYLPCLKSNPGKC